MSVRAYLRRILRRWRLIGTIAVLAVLAALAITLNAETTYVSLAKLYVASAGDDSDLEAVVADGVQVKGRALSYAAVASSEDMARVVSEDLGLDEPLTTTAGRIHTEVPFATVVINLAAEGATPEEAREVATSVVTNYNDVLAELETADEGGLAVEVTVLAEPTLPADPTSPRPVLNLLVGLLAGLMLGIAAAVLRDLVDDSVGGPDDVRGLGLVPLGVLPAGAPASDAGFERARVSLDAALDGLAGRTVVVAPCTSKDTDPAVVAGLEAVVASDGTTLVTTGPTRELADARSAARRADGAVIVATAGRTSRSDLREAALELQEVGARVLGVILRDERK
jgi:capsular polysaccharide biosynthesis protein